MTTLVTAFTLALGAAIRHYLPILLAAAGEAMLSSQNQPAPPAVTPASTSAHPVLDEFIKALMQGKLQVQPVNASPAAVVPAGS